MTSEYALGSIIQGRYEVKGLLGDGGFSTVFEVEDRLSKDGLHRKALKVIPCINISHHVVSEADILSDLDHPRVVKVYESFYQDAMFHIVMEYCNGFDFSKLIKRRQTEKKPFPESTVRRWFQQLLEGLVYIHSRNIIHRDIKPINILVHDGDLKLGDFGVSRILTNNAERADTFVGTTAYMSPEIINSQGYDQKTDIWSIGCVLYEMVTLEQAFQGNNIFDIFHKIVGLKLSEWPMTYSQDLCRVFMRALTGNPDERPRAEELLQETELLLMKTPPHLPCPPPPPPPPPPLTRVEDSSYRKSSAKAIPPPPPLPPAPSLPLPLQKPTGSWRKQCDTRVEDSSYRTNSSAKAIPPPLPPAPSLPLPLQKPTGSWRKQWDNNSLPSSNNPTELTGPPLFSLHGDEAQSGRFRCITELRGEIFSRAFEQEEEEEVKFVVKQKKNDLESVCVVCCKSGDVPKHIERLANLLYTEGPIESKTFKIEYGSVIRVTTKGKVTLDLDGTGQEYFDIEFKEGDDHIFEQGWLAPVDGGSEGRQTTRGFVVFSLWEDSWWTSDDDDEKGGKDNQCWKVLCSLPVELKLAVKESPVNKIHVARQENSPTLQALSPKTDGFWNPLVPFQSKLVDDEWIHLARELQYRTIVIDKFIREGNGSDAANLMLMDYFRRMQKAAVPDMMIKLISATKTIGHPELGQVLEEKDHRAQEEIKFQRISDHMCQDANLLREHQHFLRILGLSDADIVNIRSMKDITLKEIVYQGVLLWRSRVKSDASVSKIVACLEECQYLRLAETISSEFLGDPRTSTGR